MRESRAALGAAGLAMGAYALALGVRGDYPFGGRAQAAAQFVPLHTHLWSLLRGHGGGDLLVNWNSGYGVPFLPDLVSYLLNPFSWLVVLFPRDGVGVTVFLVTLLSIGLGSALMTLFLGRLRAGSPWLRALLATGYGLCAWVLADGAGQPSWMWGLVSLPLLCLAFDRCLRRTGWVLGTLAVAVAWTGNFYTAATASLGAGLVLVLRLLTAERAAEREAEPRWARLRALGRAVTMAAVGIGLAAPVLWVTYRAGRSAQPATVTRLATPGFTDYLAQLLPGGLSARALPNVFIGVLGLLLVATLPFNRAVRLRERIAWCGALVLVAISFVWRPAILLWHVSNAPEGNPYRSTFVLSGLLTMAAWVCLSRRPSLLALGGGVALLALVAALAHGRGSTRPITWVLLGVGVPLVVAAVRALAVLPPRRRTAVLAALTCAVFAGASWAAYSVPTTRGRPPARATTATATAATGAQLRAARRVIQDAEDWPAGRTDPGPHRFTANDPMLLGGEGGGYRSDYLPAVTAQTLHTLGAGWFLAGRQTLSFADPVGQALFGVTTSLGEDLTVRRAAAAPLVTVHGPTALDTSSVWSRQQALLGATVYQIPQPRPGGGPAPTDHGSSGWSIPATPAGSDGTVLTATCTPGREAYFYAPYLAGRVAWPSGSRIADGVQNATALPITALGPVPVDGVLRVTVLAPADTQVPALPFGCLDPGALADAVRALRAGGAREVSAGGHTISAQLPPGSTGTALVALPLVAGWRCSVDGGPAVEPQSAEGLISVPLGAGASRLACDFRQPGLAEGLPVTAAAAGVLVAVAAWRWWRRRRPEAGAATSDTDPQLSPPAG